MLPSAPRCFLTILLAFLVVSAFSFGSNAAFISSPRQNQAPQQKYVVRPAGLGSRISVLARSTRQIQIQVTDENDKPVPDMPVLFALATASLGTLAFNQPAETGFIPVAYNPGSAVSMKTVTRRSGPQDKISIRKITDAAGKASVRFLAASSTGIVAITVTVAGTNYSWKGEIIVVDRVEEIQEPTYMLISSGEVKVDGNPVQTGTTVLCGNTIETGSNGRVTIDFGSLGRVTLRPDVKIVLISCLPDQVLIKSECKTTHIKVNRGKVEAKTSDTKVIDEGKEEKVEGAADIIATGNVDFIVDCKRRPVALWIFSGGGGFTGVIVALIKARDGDEGESILPPPPPLSPLQP